MEEKKILWIALGVGGTIAIAVVAFALITWNAGNVNVSVDDEGFHVDAPLVNENISYSDIVSMEIREDMDLGDRTNGFGGNRVFSGKFHNDEFEYYTLACYHHVKKYIVVELTGGKMLVLNQDSAEKTILLYDELSEKLIVIDYHSSE